MIIRPRVIPVLLVENQSLVKTIKFENPTYLGDPINAMRIFNEKAVDELCVLDISAAKERRAPDIEYLKQMATEAFMPLSYGGGIKTFEEAKKILHLGFEKLVFNSTFIQNPSLIKEIVSYAGGQSVVASIDYKKNMFGKQNCYIEGGKTKLNQTPHTLSRMAQELGMGEVLLNCMDRDGMMNGYDIKTIEEIASSISIPLIACGGANNIHDLKQALTEGKADAVAAGSMFVYYGKKKAVLINTPTEEEYFKEGIYYENRI